MNKVALFALTAVNSFTSTSINASGLIDHEVETLASRDYISFYQNSTQVGNGLEIKGFGARMGLDVAANWGVVASIGVLGDIGSVNLQGEQVHTDANGWELTVGPSYYINDWLSVFTSAGLVNLDTSTWTYGDPYTTQVFNQQLNQLVDVVTRDREQTGNHKNTSFKYGIGVNVFAGDRFVINATYHCFNSKVSWLGNTINSKADQYSVGLGFRF